MKKLAKYIYAFKIILFMINFYFVFMMLHNILDTNLYGIIFIILYLAFALKVTSEILSKKLRYQHDIIYNGMQIGFMIYLLIISVKINLAKIYVTRITISYFRTNYIILSILIVFILTYSLLENANKNSVKRR